LENQRKMSFGKVEVSGLKKSKPPEKLKAGGLINIKLKKL